MREKIKIIPNWNGRNIVVAQSKGGVIATSDPFDNLICTGVAIWPPVEIVQKLYKSRQIRAFDDAEIEIVQKQLGYYSDIQSLNSEDAVTWSIFGTAAYAPLPMRERFVRSLYSTVNLDSINPNNTAIWLWRRLPHPDTLVPGGPEIDFGIQTENSVLLGEAKWFSGVGKSQGKLNDKDQFTLRYELLVKYGKVLFPNVKQFIVLSVSLSGGLTAEKDENIGQVLIRTRDIKWETIAGINDHPNCTEVQRYLAWKKTYSTKG
jgi:hypothetical protein